MHAGIAGIKLGHSPEVPMNQKMIVIDGKTYKSVDEMPPDVRQKYEAAMGNLDKNQDGVPDMLENMNAFFDDKNKDGMPDAFESITANVINATRIIANGREYNSLDELPPDVRAKLSQAMGKLDVNQNGIPDFAERMTNTPIQTTNVASTIGTQTPRRTQPAVAPTIEPESTSGWMIALAGLFILLLCTAAGVAVWYFFLR